MGDAEGGEWPWEDGPAWCASVRAALCSWVQEHKRELGHLGQRQLEQVAAECSCSEYRVETKRAGPEKGWDIRAILRLPCAGAHAKGSHLELILSGSTTKSAEGALLGAQLEMSFVAHRPSSQLKSERRECEITEQLIVCFEAGVQCIERSGGQDEAEGGSRKNHLLIERPALGLEGIAAVRIFIDSVAVSKCRDIIIPALDELPDVADLLCSLPLLNAPIGRVLHQMAIEEIVEEVCWQEEEGDEEEEEEEEEEGEDNDDSACKGSSDLNIVAAAPRDVHGSVGGQSGSGSSRGCQTGGGSGDAEQRALSRKQMRAAKRGKQRAGGDVSTAHLGCNASMAPLNIES